MRVGCLKKSKAKEIVTSLKELYPHPKPSHTKDEQAYCISGAFCAFIMDHDSCYRYPSVRQLAEALMRKNKDLTLSAAMAFATEITRNNDLSRHDRAYDDLERALAH